jgi:hypothetical protein
MKYHSIIGRLIIFLFTLLGLVLSLFALFSKQSLLAHSDGAWLTTLFIGLAFVTGLFICKTKTGTAVVLTLVFSIIAGTISVFMGMYWVLICMILTLIGCIFEKAKQM